MITNNNIPPLPKFLIALLVCEGAGILSGLLSQPGMDIWFINLHKPSWNPPYYIFGPVWAFLYLLMGTSWWMMAKTDVPVPQKAKAERIFLVQLFLNFWWSILFFRFRSPLFAFIDIILMVLVIIITMIRFYYISVGSVWLLLPYLLWVSFATVLNYTILDMN
jgi:benzodiazapine receptor